jgi:hypothetical protein
MVDETKLNQFVGKILGDLGGAMSAPLVRMGDKLGLYNALKEHGPMTSKELAAKTNVAERYAREWLSNQATSSYLEYDPATGKFTLPPEQAMVFAEPDSPVYLLPAFDIVAVMLENQPLVEPAFRTGKGVGWGDQSQCLFCTTGRFFRPGYQNNLVSSGCRRWTALLPSLNPAQRSPTSAAVTDFRPSLWPRPTRNRLSSATIFIPHRSSRRGFTPSSMERLRIQSSKSP